MFSLDERLWLVCTLCGLDLSAKQLSVFSGSCGFCFLVHLLCTNEKSVRNIERYN